MTSLGGLKPGFVLAKRLLRHFPYTEYLFYFLPFVALLAADGIIDAPADLLRIAPFIFAYTGIFIYNDLCDTNDPERRNPLVGAEKQRIIAWMLLGGCLLAGMGIFIAAYPSLSSRLLFAGYLVLGLAYSGLGMRFKESPAGPFVASLLASAGGPFIYVTSYPVIPREASLLLIGVFLVGASRELAHTVLDYTDDLKSGYRSFSAIYGRRAAAGVKYVTLLAAVPFLFEAYPPGAGYAIVVALFPPLLLASLALEALFDGHPSSLLVDYRRAPYVLVKFLFVVEVVAYLGFSPLYALLVVWIFATSKRG